MYMYKKSDIRSGYPYSRMPNECYAHIVGTSLSEPYTVLYISTHVFMDNILYIDLLCLVVYVHNMEIPCACI